jgi:hypothetical protein
MERMITHERLVAEAEQLTGAVNDAWVDSDGFGRELLGDSPMYESWQSGGG